MDVTVMLIGLVIASLGIVFTGLRALWLLMDRRLGPGTKPAFDDKLLGEVREELETTSHRMSRMEEEVAFMRELHAPDEERQLPPSADGESEDV